MICITASCFAFDSALIALPFDLAYASPLHCHALPLLCHALPCFALLCPALPCFALLHLTSPAFALISTEHRLTSPDFALTLPSFA